MTRELIVTADDFGLSRSVNRGIVEAHSRGIVTRTSVLATGPAFEDAVSLLHATPSIGVGVHLNLYRGLPVLPAGEVKTLVRDDGSFAGDWRSIIGRLLTRRIDLAEVEAEFRAQIGRVVSSGLRPDHLNSDKHLHIWPSLFGIVCRLAVSFGIPEVRVVREPRAFGAVPFGLRLLSEWDARSARSLGLSMPSETLGVGRSPVDLESLLSLLGTARGERVELIVHPGHVDAEFLELQNAMPNRLVASREAELDVLTSPAARAAVDNAGFVLAG